MEIEEKLNSKRDPLSTVIFVETSPSMLREMPWINLKETMVRKWLLF